MMTKAALEEAGVRQYGVISPAQIEFSEEVRRICGTDGCRMYGRTWACPPAVGTVSQCREKCLRYGSALVFCAVYPLEDSFDYEGMAAGHGKFKEVCDRVYCLAKGEFPEFLLLSNEGCGRCRTCTYPDGPCRFPDMLFPSIEGYGINVGKLAASAGVCYNGGVNTVTYFGMLLFGKTAGGEIGEEGPR